MSRRLFLFRLLAVNLFLLLVGQLFRLQIVEGPRYAGQADQNRIRRLFSKALRGVIYDRNGKLLVRNLPSFTVSVLPADLPPATAPTAHQGSAQLASAGAAAPVASTLSAQTEDALFGRLARLLQMDKNEIIKRVDAGRPNPFSPVVLKANVDRDVALMIQEVQRELPGVVVDLVPIREYLEGPLLSGIIGYIGRITDDEYQKMKTTDRGANLNDMVGRMGVEYVYDQELRGNKGEKVVEVDAAGREARTLVQLSEERPGNSLVLTIDLELQRQCTKALQQGMVRAGSSSGAVVALNPQTGEVLALVSLPSYDNNLFAAAISEADWQRLINDPNRPLFNRAIGGVYPPGSIFKLIPATGGLQDGIMTWDTRIRCDGKIVIEDQYDPAIKYTYPCWLKGGHGYQNLLDGLANSCDVYFYHIGGGLDTKDEHFTGLGIDRLNKYMKDFGLGQETGIDLPGEAAGLVPNNEWKVKQPWNERAEPWLTGDTYNVSIGQGYLLTTPLQMAGVVAAIASGGTLYRPQLVYQIVNADGKPTRAYNKEVIGRVQASAKNLDLVREGMRAAVTRGTATACNFPGLSVMGKTGTAEYGLLNEKGERPSHAWFLSYAPESNPQVALAVFIEGGMNGSTFAVPVGAQIYQYMFRQPELPPQPA